MITISGYNKRLILLSVIQLSGGHCNNLPGLGALEAGDRPRLCVLGAARDGDGLDGREMCNVAEDGGAKDLCMENNSGNETKPNTECLGG